jgi:beta-lactamase class A
MFTRRNFFITSMAVSSLLAMPAVAKPITRRFDAAERLRALEVGHARLGVCFLDTVTGESSGNRIEERFATNSTFKLAMIAACLREADHGRLNLEEILPYSEADLLPWAPVTRENLTKGGLSIATLAQAAQEKSDGVAANLLVKRLGGPSAVTAKYREMGDTVTRLDRYEPDLGMVLSADIRDTTSPLAYAQLVRRILTGNILRPNDCWSGREIP